MKMETFKFREGTVIVSVSEEELFDMAAKTITGTGEWTASLIGGTAKNLKTMLLRDPKTQDEKIFKSEAAALKAGYQAAVKQGLTPVNGAAAKKSKTKSGKA